MELSPLSARTCVVFSQPLSEELLTCSYLNLRRQMLKMFTSRRDLRSGCGGLSFCYLSRLESRQPSALHNLWVLLFHVSPRHSWKHHGDVSCCVVQITQRRTLSCLSASRHSSPHFPTGTRTRRHGAAGFHINRPPPLLHWLVITRLHSLLTLPLRNNRRSPAPPALGLSTCQWLYFYVSNNGGAGAALANPNPAVMAARGATLNYVLQGF